MGSTLSGLSKSLHSFQVETGGLPPNPTSFFWNFSCQYIFMYFQGRFGALNNVFLACHNQTIDKVQQAITCLNRRSYPKFTTSGSLGTNLPICVSVLQFYSFILFYLFNRSYCSLDMCCCS